MQYHHIKISDSVELEFATAGEQQKEAIVFLHGLGANLTCFRSQMEYFGQYYHTLAVSLRGHGQSTYPSPVANDDFNINTLAGDVLAVLDHRNIDTAHLVGNSAGGVVAYEIMRQSPERILSLTTFGTTAELHSGKMGRLVVLLDKILGPKIESWLAKQTFSKQSHVAQLVADMIASTPKDVLVNTRRALLNYDYISTIKQNHNIPLLLIQGEFDNEINSILQSTLTAFEQHPNAELIPLANAGHMANMDQPDRFNAILLSFLQVSVHAPPGERWPG